MKAKEEFFTIPYDYQYGGIYDIKHLPLKHQRWTKEGADGYKDIEYTVTVDLPEYFYFDKDALEKHIIKEITQKKIVIPDKSYPLKFKVFSRHWEEDDCSLYLDVILIFKETEKQKKLRKQLEKTLEE